MKEWYETDSNPFEDFKAMEKYHNDGLSGKFPISAELYNYLMRDIN